MSKFLRFDASNLEVSNRGKYIDIEVYTEFPEEVLNEFTPEEIVSTYDKLDDLVIFLKDYLNE